LSSFFFLFFSPKLSFSPFPPVRPDCHLNRWGDYRDMTGDTVDDCTFLLHELFPPFHFFFISNLFFPPPSPPPPLVDSRNGGASVANAESLDRTKALWRYNCQWQLRLFGTFSFFLFPFSKQTVGTAVRSFSRTKWT